MANVPRCPADETKTAAPDWWEPYRLRELARLDAQYASACGNFMITIGQCLKEIGRIEQARAAVGRAGWLPARPPRRMPNLWQIASYWAGRNIFTVDLEWPHCFACQHVIAADESLTCERRWKAACGDLERAHLVDRCAGGLDGPQNIVPLCSSCHQLMPVFNLGDGLRAISWVQGGGGRAELLSIARGTYAIRGYPDTFEGSTVVN